MNEDATEADARLVLEYFPDLIFAALFAASFATKLCWRPDIPWWMVATPLLTLIISKVVIAILVIALASVEFSKTVPDIAAHREQEVPDA